MLISDMRELIKDLTDDDEIIIDIRNVLQHINAPYGAESQPDIREWCAELGDGAIIYVGDGGH